MTIYVEVLIVLGILLTVLAWFIWNKISERRLLKKYRKEDDKGRSGNELGTNQAKEFGAGKSTVNITGLGESERREFLQETKSNNDGEDSKSNRRIKFISRK